MTLPIIIPVRRTSAVSVQVGTPPALALAIEGFEVTEVVMQDDLHYGRLITDLWRAGRGFVVVEDDVVPWPGAIAQLLACPEGWCGFQWPRLHALDASGFTYGLGCARFTDSLVSRYADAATWGEKRWDEIDGALLGMLTTAGEACHLHGPPVAHVKPSCVVLRRGDVR